MRASDQSRGVLAYHSEREELVVSANISQSTTGTYR